jgi:hypothetical protein
MKGDFTRTTFRADKHYRSVRMQQGRVQLDADSNEQADIDAHRADTHAADVVGPSGGSWRRGFAIAASAAALQLRSADAAPLPPLEANDFLVSAVATTSRSGLRERTAGQLPRQPDLPKPTSRAGQAPRLPGRVGAARHRHRGPGHSRSGARRARHGDANEACVAGAADRAAWKERRRDRGACSLRLAHGIEAGPPHCTGAADGGERRALCHYAGSRLPEPREPALSRGDSQARRLTRTRDVQVVARQRLGRHGLLGQVETSCASRAAGATTRWRFRWANGSSSPTTHASSAASLASW